MKPTKKEFLNDLYLFYRYFIASNYPHSVPAPHIKTLSRKLMALKEGTGKSRLAVSMPPRHDLFDGTPVYTENRGWTTHGDLKVGDILLSPTHKNVSVVKVLPKTTADNCFVFSNGDKIISGDEHLWEFYDYENNVTRLFYTNEIMNRETYVGNSNLPNFKIYTKNGCISLIDKYKIDSPLPSNCIEVSSTDGMYLVGRNFTPTHNSKSSMVTLAFPLWLIFQDPNVNIMIVTGSRSLADKFGIQLREYVRNLGSYFNVYLSDVKQSATHLMFCDKNKKLYRGNLLLANSGGGITGQDADYLILDDPYRGQDEEFTPTALQKKIDWVNRVVEQRIEPHTKYCILHTRWHDLANDTPVYTTNKGWTTHGDLEVGDTVLGSHHRHTRVVKVHPKALLDNCFVFSNGDKIVCGDEHLWKFHDAMNKTTRIFTAYEVMQRELHKPNSYEPVFTIPVNRSKCIGLIDCYKVSPRQGNCITVDARDGMYLVGNKLTPTHNSNDLIGYYQKTDPDAYEFVEFPALNEDNEPLWKQRYTTEELLKKKEVVGERVFQSVYQQKPIDMTSDFFNMKHLKYGFPEDYVQESVARAWDIASSDSLSDNDYTAGVKMARFGDYAIILDLIHGRFGSNTKHMIQNTAFMDSPECHVVIETGVAAAGELLHQEWKNQLQGFMVERAKVSGNKSKVDRATPLQNAIEDGKVFVAIPDGPTRQSFYDELNSFPAGEHDDITDATSHVYNYLFMNDDKKEYSARLDVVFL